MRDSINRLVFFIGWLLSPLTFWNDAFVNIPLSYILANLLFRFVHLKFDLLVLSCYWLSNLVGILIMYFSGKNLIREGRSMWRELAVFLLTIASYSAVLILLGRLGVLRPI